MNSKRKNILASVVCASVIAVSAGAGAYSIAKADNRKTSSPAAVTSQADTKAAESADMPSAVKDETVYVLASPTGSVNKIIVSDWLKNASGAGSIADVSGLKDIENVKGDESFSAGSDGTLTWQAGGQDIYYQGVSEAELPVTMKISYKLDGKEISPDELKGKSGRVTIRFDYTNNVYEEKLINGSSEKIYVPFAMLTGMILDNSVFRNVELKNGKLINDGIRTYAAGAAFPGLRESLGIDREKLELPDYIELTADVTDFRMSMTATIATNEIFSAVDADKLSAAGDSEEQLGQLTNAVTQLKEGSSSLYGGLCELLEKSTGLSDGVTKLAAGAKSVSEGAASLDTGAADLKKGAAELSGGLAQLKGSNAAINGGAKQVFDSLLASANAQIAASGLTFPALTIENYGTVLGQAIAQTGAPALTALKDQLDSYNSFYRGLLTYTEGVAQAADGAGKLSTGANTLKDGTTQLNKGAAELNAGAAQLKESIPALIEGITKLRDGSKQLSDGVKEFDEQGISKLLGAVGGDIGGLVQRVKTLTEVSQGYKAFSGISSDMNGTVKFFYRTDGIA